MSKPFGVASVFDGTRTHFPYQRVGRAVHYSVEDLSPRGDPRGEPSSQRLGGIELITNNSIYRYGYQTVRRLTPVSRGTREILNVSRSCARHSSYVGYAPARGEGGRGRADYRRSARVATRERVRRRARSGRWRRKSNSFAACQIRG